MRTTTVPAALSCSVWERVLPRGHRLVVSRPASPRRTNSTSAGGRGSDHMVEPDDVGDLHPEEAEREEDEGPILPCLCRGQGRSRRGASMAPTPAAIMPTVWPR